MNGTITINGISTTTYFEYGATASYGSKTAETTAGSGFTKVSASAELAGLSAGKTYHFRLAAAKSGGTIYGADAAFTTQIVDSDGDGLLDKDEYANETDPLLADTDGDGDSDRKEVIYGTDPLLITDSLDSHRPYKPAVSDSAVDVPLRDHIFDAITGSTVVISLTDGSSGDADGVVNGIIIDPGGPAVILAPGAGGGDGGIEASDSGGGGGGGCFITNATGEFRLAETYSALTPLLFFCYMYSENHHQTTRVHLTASKSL